MRKNGKQQTLVCQLDSGATCNVMNHSDYCALVGNANPELKTNKVTLRFYNGGTRKTMGQADITCIHLGKAYSLVFQIIAGHDRPLISAESCLDMKLIEVKAQLEVNTVSTGPNNECKSASKAIPTSKEEILHAYKDVFTGLGCLEGAYHIEIDKTVTPVKHHPRRVPIALREEVREKIDQMEAAGMISRVTDPSDWISSMVIVKTPKKLRICLDPMDLNKAIKRSHYLLPTIEEILPNLTSAKYFSVLDAKDGFLQIKLDECSSTLTTFWTPFGRYKWLRMPFGISSAPEEYQRRLHTLLEGLPGLAVIADDILVYGCGETDEEGRKDHDKNLVCLLERARLVGLKLNREKLRLRLTEVPYIGHVLTNKGLKADPNKTAAVASMPSPTSVVETQRIIGFVNYLAKFLPQLSDVSKPLRDLIHEIRIGEKEWSWDVIHEHSFQTIKQLVATTPVLQYYNVLEPVTIQCDASEYGLGATLLQNEKPVAYASKALTRTERNYAQIEKECLAIVFACERFEQYLCGKERIDVESDHAPLEVIFKRPILTAPRRLQRMLLRLQRFNLNVQYKKGKDMHIADLLSRAMVPSNTDEPTQLLDAEAEIYNLFDEICNINMLELINMTTDRMESVREATAIDEKLKVLQNVILCGWPERKRNTPAEAQEYWTFREELTVQEGIILKGMRIVVPAKIRPSMLARLHASHLGIEASLRKARDILYWPKMVEDIKRMIETCSICQEAAPKQCKELMLTHPTPKLPWERIALDIFSVGTADYLVTVDYFSDYWELDKLHSTGAETVVKHCKRHFATHGIPETVDSDKGTQLDCREFKSFAKEWEFTHCTSSPYYHQSNGKAESAVKIAKKIVKRTMQEKSDLDLAILEWRNTPSQGMQSSPVQRLMSRRTKSMLPISPTLLCPKVEIGVEHKINERKQKYKRHYDRAARPLPQLEWGQDVRVQLNPERRADPWKSGRVTSCLGSRSYIVDVEGHRFRRNRRHIRPRREAAEQQEAVPSMDDARPQNDFRGQQGAALSTCHQPERAASSDVTNITRVGRFIRKPARYIQ